MYTVGQSISLCPLLVSGAAQLFRSPLPDEQLAFHRVLLHRSPGSGQEVTCFQSSNDRHALKKVESIIEPKVIQLFGESGAPMPVQSHVDGAKFAAFIDEPVADSIRELEVRGDDMSGVSIAVLQNVVGESIVETMSHQFLEFVLDAYRSLRWGRS